MITALGLGKPIITLQDHDKNIITAQDHGKAKELH
jgi:hypothetical protein